MTSTRPGWITGIAARSSWVDASRRPVISRTCSSGIRAWWIAAGSYVSSPRAIAATVVTEPASPTRVRPPAVRAGRPPRPGPGPPRCPPSWRRSARPSACRRPAAGHQVPLGQPDAADVDGPRGRHRRCRRGRTRWSRRRCPRPGTGAAGRAAPSSRVAPVKESSASWSPVITSGSTPRMSTTPRTKSSRFCASRDAEVATNRIRSAPEFPDRRPRTRGRRRRCAPAPRERAARCGPRPGPSRTIVHPPVQVAQFAAVAGSPRPPAAGWSSCRSRRPRPGSRGLPAGVGRPPPLAASPPRPRHLRRLRRRDARRRPCATTRGASRAPRPPAG